MQGSGFSLGWLWLLERPSAKPPEGVLEQSPNEPMEPHGAAATGSWGQWNGMVEQLS